MSSCEWAKAMEDLKARAALAERAGLPKTAQSWRDAIENMARRRLSDGNLGRPSRERHKPVHGHEGANARANPRGVRTVCANA
jgi:hypothetical protein